MRFLTQNYGTVPYGTVPCGTAPNSTGACFTNMLLEHVSKSNMLQEHVLLTMLQEHIWSTCKSNMLLKHMLKLKIFISQTCSCTIWYNTTWYYTIISSQNLQKLRLLTRNKTGGKRAPSAKNVLKHYGYNWYNSAMWSFQK